MTTFLVFVRIAQTETDHYVTAATEAEAIAKVRAGLDAFGRRWAAVFV